MNYIFHHKTPDGKNGEPFSYFPERRRDSHGEGREPHAHLKVDPLASQFPTERQISLFLFFISLILYLLSMSWHPFPGLPIRALMGALKLEATPSTLDSLWNWILRAFVHFPWLSVSAWAGLFSAFCGAASVSLTGRLMIRVGYLIRNEPGPGSFIREARARRLSALVAGLYLACSVPFWVVSTRSLPGSFHLLLLLTIVWLFSQYQHWGKWRYLAGVGFLCGLGVTEFATVLLFLPLILFLVLREMFRWRVLCFWRVHLLFWLGLFAGLSLYLFNAYVLYRQGAFLGVISSPVQALGQILSAQVTLITQIRYSSGFPVIMFFSLVPWLTLFAMSRRSPWFYEGGQVVVRLIFVGGLLGVLFNASFAPWMLLGLSYLMVTPYLLLAVCMGYMAGEFWIIGEPKVLGDRSRFKDAGYLLASGFALLLPILVLVGGVWNWRVASGRAGGVMEEAATEILDRLDGRDILFSTGVLDRPIRFAVWERRLPVRVISAPRTASPIYLKQLAARFAEPPLRKALWEGDFGLFLETLLLSEDGPAQVGIVDMPDVFREFGYLVPDGLIYRLEPSEDQVDLSALVEGQRPFWAQMETLALHLAPEANLIRRYQDFLLLLTSKVANNLGVMQAERGDEEGALETLRTARRIFPKNLSVLLNLLALGQTRDLPEQAELEEAWEGLQDDMGGERWVLAIRFGYVWRARDWVRRGWVWALSGAPQSEESSRRYTGDSQEKGLDGDFAQLLDQAYQQWGAPAQNERNYQAALMRNGRDTDALMSLCRLSLRRKDLEAAEAYMREAMSMGLSEEAVLFDQAMIHVAHNEKPQAVELLRTLSQQNPGDARIFLALLLLTDSSDPLNAMARKVLNTHRGVGLSGHLVLASVFLAEQDWEEARAELEQALQIDSHNTQAWEMMVTLAQESGNAALGKSSLRALLERNPDHYLQYQDAGVQAYQQGDLAQAEELFRQGILRRRNATLLNNLAHVMLERGENLEEALAFVNEALLRKPGFPGFLNTRGAIYIALGRFGEAQTDLQNSLKKQGPKKHILLMLAESYEQTGDRIRALKVAKALARDPDELTSDEKQQVRELIQRVR